MALGILQRPSSIIAQFKAGWYKQAYRHKWAEFLLYFMFVSGLLLWDVVALNWPLARWLLLVHLVVGATVFCVVVGTFWSAHRRLIFGSNKVLLRRTGSVIEWLLVACSLSGFYLLFYGNTGQWLGQWIQDIHFYSSWLLAPLVFRHALRWSILKLQWIKRK